jgi:hypothetical protein
MSHISKEGYNQIAVVGRRLNLMRMHMEKRLQRCKQAFQNYYVAIKAHSQNLRKRVVKTVKKRMSREAIVLTFYVSAFRVKRYLRQCRKQGIVLTNLMSRRPLKKRPPLQAGLRHETQIKMIKPSDTQIKMIKQSTTVKKN